MGGPRTASFADFSLGDATVIGPADVSQNTSQTIFETFGLGFAGPASNGSRRASGGGRIDSDSVTSDWSDDFLDAISLYGNSSADAD